MSPIPSFESRESFDEDHAGAPVVEAVPGRGWFLPDAARLSGGFMANGFPDGFEGTCALGAIVLEVWLI
jgi:hypothetical protein